MSEWGQRDGRKSYRTGCSSPQTAMSSSTRSVSPHQPISNLLRIYFQDLKDNTRAELGNLLRHLKVEIDEGRLDCIEDHREGKFHRSELVDQRERDPFTEELHRLLDQTILTADSLLRDKIGRGLPLDKYQYFNFS